MAEIFGKQPDFTRPVLFLDFDDVVNIFDERRDDPESGLAFEKVTVPRGTENPRGVPISEDREMMFAYDQDVVDRLRELNAVWLTSWKGLTQEYQNPILDFDFGWVDWHYRGFSDGGVYGKAEAATEIVRDNGVPAYVIADNAFAGFDEYLKAACPGIDRLVIAPSSWTGEGLCATDLDQIEEFMSAEHALPSYIAYNAYSDDFDGLSGFNGHVYHVGLVEIDDDGEPLTSQGFPEPKTCFLTANEARAYAEDAVAELLPKIAWAPKHELVKVIIRTDMDTFQSDILEILD